MIVIAAMGPMPRREPCPAGRTPRSRDQANRTDTFYTGANPLVAAVSVPSQRSDHPGSRSRRLGSRVPRRPIRPETDWRCLAYAASVTMETRMPETSILSRRVADRPGGRSADLPVTFGTTGAN